MKHLGTLMRLLGFDVSEEVAFHISEQRMDVKREGVIKYANFRYFVVRYRLCYEARSIARR